MSQKMLYQHGYSPVKEIDVTGITLDKFKDYPFMVLILVDGSVEYATEIFEAKEGLLFASLPEDF